MDFNFILIRLSEQNHGYTALLPSFCFSVRLHSPHSLTSVNHGLQKLCYDHLLLRKYHPPESDHRVNRYRVIDLYRYGESRLLPSCP